MAFDDSFNPHKGHESKWRADAAIGVQLVALLKLKCSAYVVDYTISDRWVYVQRPGVRYQVSTKLLSL